MLALPCLQDFDVAVGVGEAELAPSAADLSGDGVAADCTDGGDGKLSRNVAERSARGDFVAGARRDAHADGGKRSPRRDIFAARRGKTGDFDGAILIFHTNPPAHAFHGNPPKLSVHAQVALTHAGLNTP